MFVNFGLSMMLIALYVWVCVCVWLSLSLCFCSDDMWELLRKGFDLVLSDMYMPDMDGFKILELVDLEMDLPVISKLFSISHIEPSCVLLLCQLAIYIYIYICAAHKINHICCNLLIARGIGIYLLWQELFCFQCYWEMERQVWQ
jgi:hypothetical protein